MTASRFTLTGLRPLEGAAAVPGEDLLGIWELTAPQAAAFAAQAENSAPPEDATATSLLSCAVEPGLIWRVELPASRREAKSELEARLTAEKVRQTYLKAAEKRLSDLQLGLAYSDQTAGAESALLAEVMALRGSSATYGADESGAISLLHL
ncbi:MAG: hypothetical protein MUQ30_03675, partial [Anaerolineae bacterium]|nr:hypothetical protein [Anaerolineae bacterium]